MDSTGMISVMSMTPTQERTAATPGSNISPTSGTPSSGQSYAKKPNSTHGTPPKIRRRNRLITSCLECRRRKLKCDKSQPCGNCTKFVRDCVFLAPALDPAAQLKLAEIKEKMGSLERTLEDDVARRGTGRSRNRQGLPSQGYDYSSDEEPTGPEDEKDLEPTPLALQDAAYYDDGNDDLMDLGVQVGKMRITERLGGFVRPKLSQEISHVINREQQTPSEHQYAGSNVPQPIIDRESVGPGKDFIAPSSSFFFAAEPQKSSLIQYLPAKNVADRLLQQYWEAVHFMARILHRPSFERQWVQFWESVHVGVDPPASLQALVMATLLSAVISMPEATITYEFRVDKAQLLDSFREGTETALYRANFLRTTKFQTLQAFVMYLIPLCRREVSRAHSALTGTAIRLAECMGLHRDGSYYGLSPVEIHVRRITWYQLCFLDIRTCEATGPRPQIRRDDFDTRMPLNVDDVDLEGPNPPTEDSDRWTDMTFSRIRFECHEMQRYIWHERPRLEKRKTSLTHVLGRVQDFWSAAERKYLPMLNKEIPLHYMALLVYRLLTLRMHMMVLHRYASNHARLMPERLRKILLSSGVQQVECAIIIETAPSLRKWSWYCGALHQFHTALLLLAELYATSENYYEDRIWKCLDYVFELPPNLNRRDKARLVLNEVVQKTEFYHSLRKVRAPKAIEDRMPQPPPSLRDGSSASPVTTTTSPTERSVPPTSSLLQDVKAHGIEFRAFAAAIPDHVYHGPASNFPSTSPHPSETGSQPEVIKTGSGTGSSPDMVLDIDWNEWDKLFPPDVNLNFPEFQHSFPPEFHAQYHQRPAQS